MLDATAAPFLQPIYDFVAERSVLAAENIGLLAAWVVVPPLDNGSVAINPLPMPLPTAATARRTAALNPARDFELPAPVPHALSSPALASHDAPLDGHLPQHLTLTLTLSLTLTLTSIT